MGIITNLSSAIPCALTYASIFPQLIHSISCPLSGFDRAVLLFSPPIVFTSRVATTYRLFPSPSAGSSKTGFDLIMSRAAPGTDSLNTLPRDSVGRLAALNCPSCTFCRLPLSCFFNLNNAIFVCTAFPNYIWHLPEYTPRI